ncbi:hypothetical protein SAMN02745157_1423 [Kaistia soli DSM 19436]|uniref:Secreted protein n=1 Tax=Kaistia soli DSM 19436 TaxID=1122133 RepID=A0A1M4Y4U2_9HYPH|nr:hypothetical protein [Kaistia soli]SHF00690.1 hypothetical protein SAMN02745157_1423 [Kaistia soli DSM 19436]
MPRLLLTVSLLTLMSLTTARADIPQVNATCPGGIEVHADQGGPIYINGKEAKLKVFNKNYYEARGGGVTISLAINPDGSPDISYTRSGGGNGVCQLANGMPSGAAANGASTSPAASSAAITRGNMPAFCRGEVSSMYSTKPSYVKTGKIVKAKNGIFSIGGTVDQGSNGIKKFMCRFDKGGRFIDVMAMTSDGE